jgi:hypothetical protein
VCGFSYLPHPTPAALPVCEDLFQNVKILKFSFIAINKNEQHFQMAKVWQFIFII